MLGRNNVAHQLDMPLGKSLCVEWNHTISLSAYFPLREHFFSSFLHVTVATKQSTLSWDCMEIGLNTKEVCSEMCWYNFLLSFKMNWVWAFQKRVDLWCESFIWNFCGSGSVISGYTQEVQSPEGIHGPWKQNLRLIARAPQTGHALGPVC